MKNRNQAKAYKKKQRYLFQRDTFIMGCESFYWKNRSPSGRAMGEFQFVFPQVEENMAVEENDEEGENTESDGEPL
jgi:hypothetical protein